MATGACSREEPQPKLAPPIMIGYSVFISPGSMNLRSTSVEILLRNSLRCANGCLPQISSQQ